MKRMPFTGAPANVPGPKWCERCKGFACFRIALMSNDMSHSMDSVPFEGQLLETLAEFEPTLVAGKDTYRVYATHHAKGVLVVWPHLLSEVFIDFSDRGEVVFSESVEYYDGEPREEQLRDIAQVLRNFFLNETRVASVGRMLRRTELQFCCANRWVSVFQSGGNET
jgi:hypothetical protein